MTAVVVLDSDFLSSFLKIAQLPLVRELFRVENLLIPPAVHREVAVTSLLPKLTALDWIEVREVDPRHLEELLKDRQFSELGAGEKEAISLAKDTPSSVLLMNDKRALHCAKSLGIDAVNIPAFLLMCRQTGECSLGRIQDLVASLQARDHYGFSKEVLKLLLESTTL